MKLTSEQALRIALRAHAHPRTVRNRIEKKLNGKPSLNERIDAAAAAELADAPDDSNPPPAAA